MTSTSERFTVEGPTGVLEAVLDRAPNSPARGAAVICHPHPLYAGTMDNKVVQTMARACVQSGWDAVRFNFRGVGASAGSYDEGRGEADDLLAVIAQCAPTGPLVLAGFSFGSYVVCRVARVIWPSRAIKKIVLVGAATSRFDLPALPSELHESSLVVHGEADDTVPLVSVMDWARPQVLPVTVVPAGSHFFHGQLPLLKSLVVRHLAA